MMLGLHGDVSFVLETGHSQLQLLVRITQRCSYQVLLQRKVSLLFLCLSSKLVALLSRLGACGAQ